MSDELYDLPLPAQPTSLAALQASGAYAMRLTWVDLANTIRYRALPIRHFLRTARATPPAITMTRTCPAAVFSTAPPGFGTTGELGA